MANCQDVVIYGECPFHLGMYSDKLSVNEKHMLMAFLANLMSPSLGIKLEYDASKSHYVTNEHGGQTCMYPFIWHGHEAMWVSYIEQILVIMIKAGWVIEAASGVDTDDNYTPWKLKISKLVEKATLPDPKPVRIDPKKVYFRVEFLDGIDGEDGEEAIAYFEKEHVATDFADSKKYSRMFAWVDNNWKIW